MYDTSFKGIAYDRCAARYGRHKDEKMGLFLHLDSLQSKWQADKYQSCHSKVRNDGDITCEQSALEDTTKEIRVNTTAFARMAVLKRIPLSLGLTFATTRHLTRSRTQECGRKGIRDRRTASVKAQGNGNVGKVVDPI